MWLRHVSINLMKIKVERGIHNNFLTHLVYHIPAMMWIMNTPSGSKKDLAFILELFAELEQKIGWKRA